MKTIISIILFQLFVGTCSIAQQLSTEIFLVSISEKNKKTSFGDPINITNHEGYDNQPWFSPDSKKIIYVSMPDTIQSDLYEYNIEDSTTTRLTESEESEFSPRYAPDHKTITMVQVSKMKAQNFSKYASDPQDVEILANGLDSIGYYCWINDSVVAFASLNNGMELFIYELKGEQFIIAATGIGRCLLKDPGSNSIIYSTRVKDKVMLNRFNIESSESFPLFDGLNTSEDYAITSDGRIYSGDGGKLYVRTLDETSQWNEVADFTKSIGSFYRLAVSPDGKFLALVSYEGKRP